MEPFIVREEYFGASMVRRKNLSFSFLNQWQTDLLKLMAVNSNDPLDTILSKAANSICDVSTHDIESFIAEKKSSGMFGEDGKIHYEIRPLTEDKANLPRGILKSPLRLYFEISRLCNLHCKSCGNSSGKALAGEMTNSEIFKVLDKGREADILETRITGGEPTQKRGWQDIVKHAKDLGMAVSLNTNGVYDNHSVRDDILNLGVDQVIISLDGNKESHEMARGKGNYDRTLDTIKYLSGKANNIRINTILKEESLGTIPEMIDMAHEYNTEMCFILLRPVGNASSLFKAIPSIDKLYNAVKLIKELKQKYPENTIFTSYDVIKSNSVKPAPDIDLTGCAAGLRGIVVDSRGRIECCGFLSGLTEEYTAGNVKDHDYSLLDMWRESPKLQAFRKLNLDMNRRCVSCGDYEKKCFGTCATMEVYKQKNDLGKDPYCFQNI